MGSQGAFTPAASQARPSVRSGSGPALCTPSARGLSLPGEEGLPLLMGSSLVGICLWEGSRRWGRFHDVSDLIRKLQNSDQACLPGDGPPLWSPPSDPGVGRGKQGGCLELGQDGSFNVDPPVPAPVGRGWEAERRHLLGVGPVQEWGPVGGGQHGAGRLARKAAEGLRGLSVPPHPLCLLGHGPARSVSAGWGPLPMRVSFRGGGHGPGEREGETVACSPVDTEVVASVNRGMGRSTHEPKG